MERIKVVKRSRHFVVTFPNYAHVAMMDTLTKNLIDYQMVKIPRTRRFIKQPKRFYFSSLNGGKIWRLHINMYEDFMSRVRIHGIAPEAIEIIEEPDYEVVDVKYNRNEHMQDRDKQPGIIKFVTKDTEHDTVLLGSQTGTGKSYMAFRIAEEFNARIVMFMKNCHIDKWITDYEKMFKDKPSRDILRLDGNIGRPKFKKRLTEVHLGRSNPKVIIIPIRTMSIWINEYEKRGRAILDEFPCLPDELFKFTKSKMRVIDEVGQEFHANFKLDLYTHCQRCLSMDATFFDDSQEVERKYRLAYPMHTRVDANMDDWVKYITAMAVHFNYQYPDKIRIKERGGMNYSHNAVEDSIMGNSRLFSNYFDMLSGLLLTAFDRLYKPGFRGMIYFYKIDMCEAFKRHLNRIRPDLKVMTYHGASGTLDEARAADIIVTTVGKTGVGSDLPGLVVVLMTNNLQARDTNIQVMGRLRKNESAEALLFMYLVADNIEKYVEFHEKKKPVLKKIASSYSETYYPELV